MGKILGYTRRSCSMADKAARTPGLKVSSQAAYGATESLPFDLMTKRANQLRLAMFRRANPEIPFSPQDYGADGSMEIDGNFGPRSVAASRSYVDFRFGPGAVAFAPGEPGVPLDEVRDILGDALRADTTYTDDAETAGPYYDAIMGKPHRDLVPLPKARSTKIDLPSSGQVSMRSEMIPQEGPKGTNFLQTLTVVGVAAGLAYYLIPRFSKRSKRA